MVKVLDFGLVWQAESHSEDVGLAGTPLYLSPEAIQSPTLVDACSDLYALGALGYFLITGKCVFERQASLSCYKNTVTETPMPPSQRANVQVSQDFEAVLLSCLEKSRARRPQTARDLALMLSRCQSAGKGQCSKRKLGGRIMNEERALELCLRLFIRLPRQRSRPLGRVGDGLSKVRSLNAEV